MPNEGQSRIWYLSFADREPPLGRGWLGACYVWANEYIDDAIIEACRQDCNPGGEVIGFALTSQQAGLVKRDHMNRLLTTRAQVDATTGTPGCVVITNDGTIRAEGPTNLGDN